MSDNFKVIVVGGGPAGLTAAHALQLAGIDFVVLEAKKDSFVDEGASLVLGPQSLRVLHQFGILREVLDIAGEITDIRVVDIDGNFIKNSPNVRVLRKNHGIAPVIIHRAELMKTIYDTLPEIAKSRYLTGKKVVDIETDEQGVKVTCEDDSVYEGSIVLAADGVHSKSRRIMRNMALRADTNDDWDAEVPFPSMYKCMWCSFPRPLETGLSYETHHWDRSIMFLTGAERGWLFVYEKLPEKTSERVHYTDEDVEKFAANFGDFHITETLKLKDVYSRRTSAGMANLEEGILQHWFWDRIVLVGDASHKFTPNAGAGFQNGIQDVVALCNQLHTVAKEAPDGKPTSEALRESFLRYQEQRIQSIQPDAKRSLMLSRVHSWASGFYYFLSKYVFCWRPIEYFMYNFMAARTIRRGRVLDYVHKREALEGRVSWEHPMRE